MKTTLNLNERLLRGAKKLAAERSVTLTSIVEEALRALLTAAPRSQQGPFRWSTVKGRRVPDVDVSDREALFERMENRR